MMQPSETVDGRYNRALRVALMQIAPVLLLAILVLDGGTLFRQLLFALLAYLGMLCLVVTHHPTTPTRFDLLLLKWAFLPLCLIVLVIAQRF